MTSLAHSQHMTMLALERGPDHLELDMFVGTVPRIIAGMKVHANTISHGRLVALEETFPRTRDLCGAGRFNALSRRYVEDRYFPSCSLATVGADFPHFLELNEKDFGLADLARFEWLRLKCYHAPDEYPLALADLAGIDPTDLTNVEVARHPAVQFARFGRKLHRELAREAPSLDQAHGILLTRPDSQVLVHPASPAMFRLLALTSSPISLGNLFAALTEPGRKNRTTGDDHMRPIMSLLQAGALVRAGKKHWQMPQRDMS